MSREVVPSRTSVGCDCQVHLTLRGTGRWSGQVLRLWLTVTLASGLAAGAGYVLLQGASPAVVAGIQTFAAGAIITMLADTMIPEATEHAGRLVGLVTMIGFALAFLLSALG